MEESAHRLWDVRTKLGGAALAALGVFAGLWQFQREQSEIAERNREAVRAQAEADRIASRSAADLAFQRTNWEKRREHCFSVAGTVGSIAAFLDKPDVLDREYRNFLRSYWGELVMVEDEQIRQALIKFKDEVADYRSGRSSETRIQKRAYAVSESCRISLEAVPVPTFEDVENVGGVEP